MKKPNPGDVDDHRPLMDDRTAPARAPRKVATRGGMVVGLGETNPPTAFVAELGDPARDAARSVTEPLMGAAGHAPPRVPRVRVGGRELATQSMKATGIGTAATQAQTVDGSGLMRIAGESLASEGDGAATGAARMIIGGGTQRSLELGGTRTALDPTAIGDTVAAMRGQIPVRTQYADPSAAQRMLSRCSPARRGDLVPSELAVLVGDPVDVATGAVVTDAIELDIASPPLQLCRRYASNRSDREGGFGFGWTHDFEQAVWLEAGRVVLRESDGREVEFDTMGLPGQVARAGDVLHDTTGRLTLRSAGRLHWELRGRICGVPCIRHFRPEPGESAQGRDRGMSRLVRIVPTHLGPHASLVELTYRNDARLHEIRTGGRVAVTFEYDAAGRIESLWTPQSERLSRHARFLYSDDGDLVAALDTAGHARRYEYVGHLLVGETNRDGGGFFYGYDGHGRAARCIRSWGAGGMLDRALMHDGQTTQVTDSLGNVTEYRIDPVGTVAAIIDPHGDRTRHRHDERLHLVEIALPDGARTIDAYDDRGNLVKRRLPGGATWRMAYDEEDRLVQGWDPGGAQWSLGYDAAGSLVRVEDPLGHMVRLEYDGGRLARIVDALGQVTSAELDDVGNVVTLAPPQASGAPATHFEYDRWGRIAATRSAGGERMACVADANGQLVGHHREGAAIRLARSPEGELVGIDAPGGRWGIARDAFGVVLAVHGPAGAITYDHDTEGRLVAARSGSSALLALLRDARGLVSAASRRGGAPSSIQHTPGGRRVEQIVGDGATLQLRWDEAGRLVESDRTHTGGASRATFTYGADGLVTGATNEHARCVIERDARGAVVRQRMIATEDSGSADGEWSIDTASRDFLGRRHGLDVEPGLRVSILRNGAGQVERIAVVDRSVWDIEFTRSDDGRTQWLRAEFGDLELRYGDDGALRSAVRTGRDGHVTQWHPGAKISPPQPLPAGRDALGRPAGGCLMDEDRLLRGDGAWWLHHPDRGHPIARIAASRVDFVLPDATSVPTDPIDDRDERWHDESFPLARLPALMSTVRAPAAILAQAFAHHAWTPIARPVGGAHPWSPESWTAEPRSAAAPHGRLDAPSLLAIFAAAFPTAGLRPSPA